MSRVSGRIVKASSPEDAVSMLRRKTGEILDLGVEYDIIKKSGSWYSYKDSKLAQGRDATKTLLHDNPELCEELEALITQAIDAKKE